MEKIDHLKSQWIRFERPFQLLSEWDGTRGILFSADDASADEAVELTANLLAPEKTFRLEGQTLAAWREETALLREKEHQASLLESTPKTVCIIALHLDQFSEGFHIDLKGLFERAKRPFACLASAIDPDRIPDYLRSHFSQCHKVGRPRAE